MVPPRPLTLRARDPASESQRPLNKLHPRVYSVLQVYPGAGEVGVRGAWGCRQGLPRVKGRGSPEPAFQSGPACLEHTQLRGEAAGSLPGLQVHGTSPSSLLGQVTFKMVSCHHCSRAGCWLRFSLEVPTSACPSAEERERGVVTNVKCRKEGPGHSRNGVDKAGEQDRSWTRGGGRPKGTLPGSASFLQSKCICCY